MSKYRTCLPELNGQRFLTDGGMETILVFDEGKELPCFASFPLGQTAEGRDWLNAYAHRHIDIAERYGMGFILGSATWRASRDWGQQLGFTKQQLSDVQQILIDDLFAVQKKRETPEMPIVISGCIGPRGDGYDPGMLMTEGEAQDYHSEQIATLEAAGVDVITAMTLTNIPEATGVARAATAAGLPVVISFTVETDGRLPTGDELAMAIEEVDAATNKAPAYYMINCAHPDHFEATLAKSGPWRDRLMGLRANASRKSHAELDCCETLDNGDPVALGQELGALATQFPEIKVLGGCCGTDPRHIEEIAKNFGR
ncbi:MAG: homocysteine S-methyltransferase family protein [Hyphomicrobiaceae bacterium]